MRIEPLDHELHAAKRNIRNRNRCNRVRYFLSSGGVGGTSRTAYRALVLVVQLRPVPRIPTVDRTPRWPNISQAPRPPTDVETPDFETFSHSPGRTRIVRRKRNGIDRCCSRPGFRSRSSQVEKPQLTAPSARDVRIQYQHEMVRATTWSRNMTQPAPRGAVRFERAAVQYRQWQK